MVNLHKTNLLDPPSPNKKILKIKSPSNPKIKAQNPPNKHIIPPTVVAAAIPKQIKNIIINR